jgi:RNA polymerase sigma-70 factor (ECF subfamily)
MASSRPGYPVDIALSLSEQATVRAAQAGDAQAREALATSCRRIAFLFALQLTGHRDDAMDLAQDATLRFFASLSRFDAARAVRPWLLQIVRNLVRDRARRMRVRRTESLDRDREAVVFEAIDPSPSPEQNASKAELQRILWIAVCRLPQRYREVIALRDYLGLSYREIAEALRIPRGTVMSRLHRARTRLRDAARSRLEGEARND